MNLTCCDTSFLISLYRTDTNTPKALACLKRLRQPLTLTHINEFEFEHALYFSIWRQQQSATQVAQLHAAYQRDIKAGQLIFDTPNLASALREARRLSALYTAIEGHRSFDVLHVAAALELGANEFFSFDTNQRKLAKAEGLKLNP